MILDTFMYSGEEDMLDLRLNTLNPIVDKFVILESPKSHSLIQKGLKFPEQKNRFLQFQNKIDYYSIDYCTNENFLLNDWIGRGVIENILYKVYNIKEKDIILHGDLDEIPKLNILKQIILSDNNLEKPYTFMVDSRQLCLDLELITERHGRTRGNFPGSILFNGKYLYKNQLHWLRQIRLNNIINNVNYKDTFSLIENSGWHFSYCAGINETINKFKFFSHTNEMNNCIKDKEGLINCIKNKISFDRETKLMKVNWDKENIPEYVLNNSNLFKNMLSFNF